MERYLIKHLCKTVGYEEPNIDGMFCPGGSNANTYGMILGRHHAFPETKKKGIRGLGPLVMFASEEVSHMFNEIQFEQRINFCIFSPTIRLPKVPFG